MKIALVCASGMSTSLLVANMKKFAEADDIIDAYAFAVLADVIDKYDVVLVGPQVRFQYSGIKEIAKAHGKGAALIDIRIYGNMDGKEAIRLAKEALKAKEVAN